MTVYILTAINAVIMGVVAYLFYAFRQAVDASGVKQIDDYLHELEGSVAQLTEQFERTSTKISKDLLRKTTELQALIGECDTKLAQAGRLKTVAPAEPPLPRRIDLSVRDEAASASEPAANEQPEAVAAFIPAPPIAERPAAAARTLPTLAAAADGSAAGTLVVSSPAVAGEGFVPAALAARRMSASELLGVKPAAAVVAPESAASIQPAQAEPEQAPNTPTASQPNEKYRLIFLLASEGMDAGSIAKHTNLTRGEVVMLLDLRRQGKI